MMEYEVSDWEEFGTIKGLCRKAGVSQNMIANLVAKELVDNFMDASDLKGSGPCKVDQLEEDGKTLN